MSIDESCRACVDAFRAYIEDSAANDDRYGAASRQDTEDGTILATRFEAGPSCWLEVVIYAALPQLRIGFMTNDPEVDAELEQSIRDGNDTLSSFVGAGFVEAGLEWPDPIVNHQPEGDGRVAYTTPLDLDELRDLDLDEIRNKTLRMLEGYLIAFGPAVWLDEED